MKTYISMIFEATAKSVDPALVIISSSHVTLSSLAWMSFGWHDVWDVGAHNNPANRDLILVLMPRVNLIWFTNYQATSIL